MDLSPIINQMFEKIYQPISNLLPERYKVLLDLAIFTLLITIYALFIWKFYRFLARKDMLQLNLSKYNKSNHNFFSKLFVSLLFFLEYIIMLPLAVFFWFAIFSGFLLILSESQTASQILLVSATVVAAIRFSSYFSEDLAKDLAKMIPFMVLSVFLLNPNFISVTTLIQRANELPLLLDNIAIYVIFIVALEVIMRFIFTIYSLFISKEEKK